MTGSTAGSAALVSGSAGKAAPVATGAGAKRASQGASASAPPAAARAPAPTKVEPKLKAEQVTNSSAGKRASMLGSSRSKLSSGPAARGSAAPVANTEATAVGSATHGPASSPRGHTAVQANVAKRVPLQSSVGNKGAADSGPGPCAKSTMTSGSAGTGARESASAGPGCVAALPPSKLKLEQVAAASRPSPLAQSERSGPGSTSGRTADTNEAARVPRLARENHRLRQRLSALEKELERLGVHPSDLSIGEGDAASDIASGAGDDHTIASDCHSAAEQSAFGGHNSDATSVTKISVFDFNKIARIAHASSNTASNEREQHLKIVGQVRARRFSTVQARLLDDTAPTGGCMESMEGGGADADAEADEACSAGPAGQQQQLSNMKTTPRLSRRKSQGDAERQGSEILEPGAGERGEGRGQGEEDGDEEEESKDEPGVGDADASGARIPFSAAAAGATSAGIGGSPSSSSVSFNVTVSNNSGSGDSGMNNSSGAKASIVKRPRTSALSSSINKRAPRRTSSRFVGALAVPVTALPRGGVYVQTKSDGALQFGIPPETIKDSMALGLEVPKYYVVPKDRFNIKLGLTMCEVEFPAYFNFFLRKSNVKVIAPPHVQGIVRRMLEETIEGPSPELLFVDSEYPANADKEGRFSFAARPDHVKEIGYFKEPREGRAITVDSLVQFIDLAPLQQQRERMSAAAIELAESLQAEEVLVAVLGNGVEVVDANDEYFVVENGAVVARVHNFLTSWAPAPKGFDANFVPKVAIDPPAFGITVLGSSHGFDPAGTTSGFVLWINKKGIMVDPPPNATESLHMSGIVPSMITGIILTHCHADHDAGTFQKILKEGRITLITTQTVFSTFIRKYSVISGFSEAFLQQLFEHRIVKVGERVHWGGGTLRFFYSLHALPCVGFEAIVAGKSFVYSADTYYDPAGLSSLRDRGYLSKERCEALTSFPFDYDLVLHEAGIPPIHTSVEVLKRLPDEVKKRLYLIHIAEAKCKESGLRLARVGVENSIIIDTPAHEHATSAYILNLLRSTDIFRHFSIAQAGDILQLCRHCAYAKDEYICRAGEVGVHFYIILSGFCTVRLASDKTRQSTAARAVVVGSAASSGGGASGARVPVIAAASSNSSSSSDSPGVLHKDLENRAATPRPVSVQSARSLLSAATGTGSESSETSDLQAVSEQSRIFGAGDYLGELALLSEEKVRSADIIAVTDLTLIKLDSHAFKYLIDTTPGLQYRMERLGKIRCSLSWKAIAANSVLSRLRSTQRAQLQSVMQVTNVSAGDVLWHINKPVRRAYLVATGELEFLELRDELVDPFRAGTFFCNISSMLAGKQLAMEADGEEPTSRAPLSNDPSADSRVTLAAKTDAELYYIDADDVLDFLDENPGVYIQLISTLAVE